MTQLPLDQKIAAFRRFTRFFSQRLGSLDSGPAGSPYSATEVRVLVELAAYEQRTVTALSRALGLDAGYLSRVIRRLETTGMVSKSADSADSRQQPLSLTQAGRAEVAALDTVTTARYAALVRTLPAHIHAPLLDAMERIETAFGADVPDRDPTPWLLRPQRAGDISYITQRAIVSALEEFEFGAAYEALLMRTATDFVEQFDATRDCSWIAERDGVIVGAVLVRRARTSVARLTMLHVESQARGIGVGRRLVSEALNFARRAGYESMELELLAPMKSARFIVHAAGFRHASDEPDLPVGTSAVSRQTWRIALREPAPGPAAESPGGRTV